MKPSRRRSIVLKSRKCTKKLLSMTLQKRHDLGYKSLFTPLSPLRTITFSDILTLARKMCQKPRRVQIIVKTQEKRFFVVGKTVVIMLVLVSFFKVCFQLCLKWTVENRHYFFNNRYYLLFISII